MGMFIEVEDIFSCRRCYVIRNSWHENGLIFVETKFTNQPSARGTIYFERLGE